MVVIHVLVVVAEVVAAAWLAVTHFSGLLFASRTKSSKVIASTVSNPTIITSTGERPASGMGSAGISLCPLAHGSSPHLSNFSSCTLMLIDIASVVPLAAAARASTTRVVWYINGTVPQITLLDTSSSSFECGKNETTNVTTVCGIATVTSIRPDVELPFVLLARLGCFELFLGDDLMLVQTAQAAGMMYPVLDATIGPVLQGSGNVEWSNISAWQMSALPPPMSYDEDASNPLRKLKTDDESYYWKVRITAQ